VWLSKHGELEPYCDLLGLNIQVVFQLLACFPAGNESMVASSDPCGMCRSKCLFSIEKEMSEVTSSRVRPSLDSPPIVVVAGEEKTLVGLLFFVALGGAAAACIFMDLHMTLRGYIGAYGSVVISCFCIPLGVWRLISPPRLTISPQGLVFFNGFKTQRYTWQEISEFVSYLPWGQNYSPHVGFIREKRQGEDSIWHDVTKTSAGIHGTLGSGWLVSTPDLVDLLNSARDRWGKDGEAGLTRK